MKRGTGFVCRLGEPRSLSGKRTESNHAAPSGNRRAKPAGEFCPPATTPSHPEPFLSHPEAHPLLIEANRAPKAAKAPGLAQITSAVALRLWNRKVGRVD